MAHVTAPASPFPDDRATRSIPAILAAWFARIAEANPRLRHARALQALSDDQLAALGIERAGIVHIAFRDAYYR